jgi:hypothetical protein
MFCEVVAPFFSSRRHPNSFLRESACLTAVVQVHPNLTPNILMRPSRRRKPLKSTQRPATRPSPLTNASWFYVGEGFSFSKREPMQPRCYKVYPPGISGEALTSVPRCYNCYVW